MASEPSGGGDVEWFRVKDLLADCLEATPDERESLLSAADPAARRRVRVLLAAEARAPASLDAVAFTLDDDEPTDDAPPTRLRRVGPYRLGRVLGEGGMGLVYEAFQEHPERSVALKILRPSVVSDRTIQRFHAEIEILGRLQHPGIAAIIDAGVIEEAADGAELAVPWFAMELVDGAPLNRYAADRPLDERLTLFLDVCDAVHYAHQRGVIHRDLKPANILVSREEADDQPLTRVRVLDFGIARATMAGLSPTALVTVPGLAVGTLPYMSPEQVEGDPAEMDVRTDVYALGAMLYELLTGRLPLDVGDDPPTVGARRVLEEEPDRPGSIDPTLDADLDTIVECALAKDRERRYASVSELASDLRRFRRHEPIHARPPRLGYLLAKFARRHRGLVAGLAVAAALLLASVITIAVVLGRTRVERDKATSALSLLREMLTAASPYQQGVGVTVVSILDQAVHGMGTEHPPEVEATLRRAIGEAYVQLGRSADGVAQLGAAVRLLRDALGPDDERTLDAEVELAFCAPTAPTPGGVDPRELSRRCDSILGADHPTTLRSRIARSDLLGREGRWSEATSGLAQALAEMRELLGEDHRITLEAKQRLTRLLANVGRVDEAIALLRERLDSYRRAGDTEHTASLLARGDLAVLLDQLGRHDEAEPHHRSLYANAARLFGEESRQAFHAEEALAQNLIQQHKLEEAERFLLGGVDRARRLGVLPQRLNSLAVLYGGQGRHQEAEDHARRSYEATREQSGADSEWTRIAFDNWASMLDSMGRSEEALAMLRESLERWRQALGPENVELIGPLNYLANCLARLGRWSEAEPLYREAVGLARDHLDAEHVLRVTSISSHGISLASLARDEEAEPLLVEGMEAWNALPDRYRSRSENVLRSLASVYDRTGRTDRAEAIREQVRSLRTDQTTPLAD